MNENKSLAVPMTINAEDISKSLKMELTKDDAIAYKVSKEEDRLDSAKQVLEESLKTMREDASELVKQIDKMGKALIDERYGKDVRALGEILKRLGVTRKQASLDQNGVDHEKKVIEARIKLSNENSYSASLDENLKPVPFSSAMLTVQKDLEAKNKEIGKTINSISDLRNKLANMGRIERKAKAVLFEQIVRKNKEAASLLESGENK